MTEDEADAKYLGERKDRSAEETARHILSRLEADDTEPDAGLLIAYRESGMFRRVIAGLSDSITGRDIRLLCEAVAKPSEKAGGAQQ